MPGASRVLREGCAVKPPLKEDSQRPVAFSLAALSLLPPLTQWCFVSFFFEKSYFRSFDVNSQKLLCISQPISYPMSKHLPEHTAPCKSLENASSLDKGKEFLARSPLFFQTNCFLNSQCWQVFAYLFICRIVSIHFLIILQLWASCYLAFITFTDIGSNSTSAYMPCGIQFLILKSCLIDTNCSVGVQQYLRIKAWFIF